MQEKINKLWDKMNDESKKECFKSIKQAFPELKKSDIKNIPTDKEARVLLICKSSMVKQLKSYLD